MDIVVGAREFSGELLLVLQELTLFYQLVKHTSTQGITILITGLYCSMGYASYMIYRYGSGFAGDDALPLALYGTQLALNWALRFVRTCCCGDQYWPLLSPSTRLTQTLPTYCCHISAG
ncbi:TSPO-like protein [Mya arenaria]|uniref:TSPO-like protein n=1 Tax=Mya arenaria TaxID=6604 RepID=A0ABY7EFW4_MYAAR|nr:TSPO-like protein [Mya arenaria]